MPFKTTIRFVDDDTDKPKDEAVGSRPLLAVRPDHDLCLRMMVYAAFADHTKDRTIGEIMDDLKRFFSDEVIAEAKKLSKAGTLPAPANLDVYR